MPHNNSNESMKPNHLYEIVDKVDEYTFKYGISDGPIEADGMSGRMREQINFLNLLYEWKRFFGRILLFNIPGKREARRIEKDYIKRYEELHGHKPKGNPR